ncbi:Clp protease N-terminal domain-containing protein [Cumulibacter manganitolerans]|uniref:Clp protease N-terminal domain-containing protein n=1 Tax=Cumulibacter manganitolerans TaxID=1884992 RepID=UPI001294D966|nr:Clp protease N-terminal domain-containing protein [Cumulibacter manganitolerans]
MITRRDGCVRTICATAAVEARLRHDPLVGTEHLLVALLHDPLLAESYVDGRSPRHAREALGRLDTAALRSAGIDAPDLPGGPPIAPNPGGDLSAGAKDALARAHRIGRAAPPRRTAPEDLLRALVLEPRPNRVAEVLREMGIDPADVLSRLAA